MRLIINGWGWLTNDVIEGVILNVEVHLRGVCLVMVWKQLLTFRRLPSDFPHYQLPAFDPFKSAELQLLKGEKTDSSKSFSYQGHKSQVKMNWDFSLLKLLDFFGARGIRSVLMSK